MNQPVLSIEGKVSCWRQQQKLLMAFEASTDQLQVRITNQCATQPLITEYLSQSKCSRNINENCPTGKQVCQKNEQKKTVK